VDLTLTLTGANSDTITFDADNYIVTSGVKGFGIPATKVRIQESATDGGIFRHTKRGIRELDLPIMTVGNDRADVELKLRRLSNILQNTAGAARLTATFDNGDVFYLDVYYTGGGETVFGEDAGSTYAMWMVALQAPTPFWTSAAAQTFAVVQASSGRGLLPRLTSMRVTSSQAIGVVTVNNSAGDVPSYPIWTVYGPMDNLTISANGVGFVYAASIGTGEIITIDTFNNTVVDAAGNNMYGNLAPAPKFFPLQPGTTSVTVRGDNATNVSQIACTYYPRREVLH